jgi:hypothetical protein
MSTSSTCSLIARITDTHANLWSAPPRSACGRAASDGLRFVESQVWRGARTRPPDVHWLAIRRRHRKSDGVPVGACRAVGAITRVEPADAVAGYRPGHGTRRLRRLVPAFGAIRRHESITAQRPPLGSESDRKYRPSRTIFAGRPSRCCPTTWCTGFFREGVASCRRITGQGTRPRHRHCNYPSGRGLHAAARGTGHAIRCLTAGDLQNQEYSIGESRFIVRAALRGQDQ